MLLGDVVVVLGEVEEVGAKVVEVETVDVAMDPTVEVVGDDVVVLVKLFSLEVVSFDGPVELDKIKDSVIKLTMARTMVITVITFLFSVFDFKKFI